MAILLPPTSYFVGTYCHLPNLRFLGHFSHSQLFMIGSLLITHMVCPIALSCVFWKMENGTWCHPCTRSVYWSTALQTNQLDKARNHQRKHTGELQYYLRVSSILYTCTCSSTFLCLLLVVEYDHSYARAFIPQYLALDLRTTSRCVSIKILFTQFSGV